MTWVVGAAVLSVYASTTAPTIVGGDAGELVAESCHLGTAHQAARSWVALREGSTNQPQRVREHLCRGRRLERRRWALQATLAQQSGETVGHALAFSELRDAEALNESEERRSILLQQREQLLLGALAGVDRRA